MVGDPATGPAALTTIVGEQMEPGQLVLVCAELIAGPARRAAAVERALQAAGQCLIGHRPGEFRHVLPADARIRMHPQATIVVERLGFVVVGLRCRPRR